MARRMMLGVVMLALVCGCGRSTPATLTDQGRLEMLSGQYDQAIATCTAAIAADPKNADAYLFRGRAFQIRNVLGDPQRAIADFSEAIRLAPNSSDAYYGRALVYRDLGDKERSDADDRAARAADGTLQEVYRALPDTTPAVIAKARQDMAVEADASAPKASGNVDDILPKSEDQRKEVYEKLKEEFEPGFGSLRTDRGKSGPANKPSMHGYRSRLPQAIDESTTGQDVLGGGFSVPRGALPLSPPGAEGQGGFPSGQDTVDNRKPPSTPSSPFQPRVAPSAPGDGKGSPQSPFGGGLQSPFGQRLPAPTGYREPLANPFSRPSTGPFGAQPRQPYTNPYSNPAVRPANPRDYDP